MGNFILDNDENVTLSSQFINVISRIPSISDFTNDRQRNNFSNGYVTRHILVIKVVN